MTVVEAWIQTTIACRQCNGTGYKDKAIDGSVKLCSGPHTQVTIDHGPSYQQGGLSTRDIRTEILYADPDRIGRVHDDLCYHLDDEDGCPVRITLSLRLPPAWTIT